MTYLLQAGVEHAQTEAPACFSQLPIQVSNYFDAFYQGRFACTQQVVQASDMKLLAAGAGRCRLKHEQIPSFKKKKGLFRPPRSPVCLLAGRLVIHTSEPISSTAGSCLSASSAARQKLILGAHCTLLPAPPNTIGHMLGQGMLQTNTPLLLPHAYSKNEVV